MTRKEFSPSQVSKLTDAFEKRLLKLKLMQSGLLERKQLMNKRASTRWLMITFPSRPASRARIVSGQSYDHAPSEHTGRRSEVMPATAATSVRSPGVGKRPAALRAKALTSQTITQTCSTYMNISDK
ncbi:uncharacterized protein LOC144781619 [Lissotriton helveticus]